MGLGMLVLAACSNPAKEAEKRYEIVARTGSHKEKCDAGHEVAKAYLNEGDARQYELWQIKAQTSCIDDQLEQMRGGSRAAQALEAEADRIMEAADRAIENQGLVEE